MTQNHEIKFGGGRIGFGLRRSTRRTLAITVRPDLSVLVTAPRKTAVETLLALILEIYRVRVQGRDARLLYESRLVGLLGQPEAIITTMPQ